MRQSSEQGPGQRAFAEQNHFRQTLLFGGPNPTFRKGVQIRTLTGLGGGVIVTPALTLLLGVDIRYAIGASLVSVIAPE